MMLVNYPHTKDFGGAEKSGARSITPKELLEKIA